MKKKIIIAIVLTGVALATGASVWYFGFYKPEQQEKETCDILAVSAFKNAFGNLDDIYALCRSEQLQKLYTKNKKINGLDGATLEEHQEVENLCECATENLAMSIIGEWSNKCRSGNTQWIQDSQEIKHWFDKEPGTKYLLFIESNYDICEMTN